MSLRDALAGLKENQAASTQPIEAEPPARKPRKESPTKPQAVKKTAAGQAKSTNPEYVQLKVYVHGDRRRRAAHKWENEGGRDMSDLIEKLFDQYLSS